MSRYRAADLWRVPSLLSLSRLPLAACFPVLVSRPTAALGLLALAGFTDMLDGWWARRRQQVTPTGMLLDPLADKLFVLTVAVTLVTTGQLEPVALLLISTRELAELPLAIWFLASPRLRRAPGTPAANPIGKLVTVLQFACIATALFRTGPNAYGVTITAAAGVIAAATYWRSAILRARA